MKRIALTVALLGAVWCLFAQQTGKYQFDLADGVTYRGTNSQTLNFTAEGKGLVVSGEASGAVPGGGGGYIIEAGKGTLKFSGYKRLFINVSGIDGENDRFSSRKLLKLELNGKPQQTITPEMRSRNDPDYINARNEVAEFDISKIKNIKSFNLVFFDCVMNNVRIEVFYTK